jgi:ribonuclease HI
LLEAQLQRVQGARLCWVRGHSGVPGNERADALAAAGRAGVILLGEVTA